MSSMKIQLERTARKLKICKLQSQNGKKLPLRAKSIDRLFKERENRKRVERT